MESDYAFKKLVEVIVNEPQPAVKTRLFILLELTYKVSPKRGESIERGPFETDSEVENFMCDFPDQEMVTYAGVWQRTSNSQQKVGDYDLVKKKVVRS